eukprot:scpid101506/ scgid6361/ 
MATPQSPITTRVFLHYVSRSSGMDRIPQSHHTLSLSLTPCSTSLGLGPHTRTVHKTAALSLQLFLCVSVPTSHRSTLRSITLPCIVIWNTATSRVHCHSLLISSANKPHDERQIGSRSQTKQWLAHDRKQP